MPTYSLKANIREITGRKSSKLRKQELIPAVIYGPDIKNKNIAIKKNDFLKIYNRAGSSSLVDLQIDNDTPVKTLIQDLQYDPVTQDLIHVDFHQIKEGKKITTSVELDYQGEAPVVKELGGIIVKNYDEIEIECLPSDLEKIDMIKVDLSVLKNFNDTIHIKDLPIPPEIKIMEDPGQVVVLAAEPREEEVEEKPAAIEEVEGVVKEEKPEGAEGEEAVNDKKEDSGK